MADRFYFSGDWSNAAAGSVVNLTDSEAHHLAKVLRKQVDDLVELFDGHGKRADARITRVEKRDVELELLDAPKTTPKNGPRIALAVSPPKGDRFRWLIEKATEIGIAKVIPLRTDRAIVNPGESKLEKLRQTMIAACKQSGRDEFLEITSPLDFQNLPQEFSGHEQLIYGAVPSEDSINPFEKSAYVQSDVVVVIGPEGGLTEEELSHLRAWGGQPISVSPHVLRIETAAIALASILLSALTIQSD